MVGFLKAAFRIVMDDKLPVYINGGEYKVSQVYKDAVVLSVGDYLASLYFNSIKDFELKNRDGLYITLSGGDAYIFHNLDGRFLGIVITDDPGGQVGEMGFAYGVDSDEIVYEKFAS